MPQESEDKWNAMFKKGSPVSEPEEVPKQPECTVEVRGPLLCVRTPNWFSFSVRKLHVIHVRLVPPSYPAQAYTVSLTYRIGSNVGIESVTIQDKDEAYSVWQQINAAL